jgi:hypothetical protein
VVDCVVGQLRASDIAAPSEDELEITFLGPGFGESTLIHLGNGAWVVVDSSINASTRSSRVLDYLTKIGVSPTSLQVIVATHWHDDHIRGLSQLVEAAPEARFVCSAAVQHREFYTLVASARRPMTTASPGIAEMARILELLEARRDGDNARQRTPIWAKENVLLYDGMVGSAAVRLQALSPSDWSMTRAWQSLGRLLPRPMEPKRVLPAPQSNEASVALWLVVDEIGILLGADLEETTTPAGGWKRVVANPLRSGTASVFKVPHHGSSNAFSNDVWRTMLVPGPIAVIVPFRSGSISLPTEGAVRQYCALTKNLFLTVRPGAKRVRRRRGAEAKILRALGSSLTEVFGEEGMVRVRITTNEASPWSVGLLQPAYAAC